MLWSPIEDYLGFERSCLDLLRFMFYFALRTYFGPRGSCPRACVFLIAMLLNVEIKERESQPSKFCLLGVSRDRSIEGERNSFFR